MKKVIKYKNGGNSNIPSAVGTNRTYWQTIKENIQEYYDKLKGNTFAEMLFPFEDVSRGNTVAMIPYIVPGTGVVKSIGKTFKPFVNKATKSEKRALTNYLEDLYKNDNSVQRIESEIEEKARNFDWNKELEEQFYYKHGYSYDDLMNGRVGQKYGGSTQFKCGGMKRVPRKKAFWGALIGAALSAIGGIGSSIINSNKQQEIAMQNYKQQKELMDKMDAQNKQAAENEYYNKLNANSGIYNSIRKSLFSAKMGGKFKKCRKKAEWGADDTGNLLTSLFGIGSNIATTAIDANTQLKTNELALAAAGRIGKQYNYVTPNFNSIREIINERNSDINEIQKRRRGQLNSWYLS